MTNRPLTCSIVSRCRRRWVPLWPGAWRCQSRTAWGFQTQDPAEDSGGERSSLLFSKYKISLIQLPGAWCLCGKFRLSGCRQETWEKDLSLLHFRLKTLLFCVQNRTWIVGTCKAWWRWLEWFASACCTVSPPKWWAPYNIWQMHIRKFYKLQIQWNILWFYAPCTQSQGCTPRPGSGRSHPDKKYVIAFANQYESTFLWPKRLRITVCIWGQSNHKEINKPRISWDGILLWSGLNLFLSTSIEVDK